MDGPVLYFDGVCNVCNASVQFVLDHERAPSLRFASLQSQSAKEALVPKGINPEDLDSLVLVEDGVAYKKSAAALRVARYLKAPWSWVTIFSVIPQAISDFFYTVFARNRYRLFGKKDECMIPTPELRARFI